MLISMQRRMVSICRASNDPRCCRHWRLSIVVICSKRTMLPSRRNADGGTGYCVACQPCFLGRDVIGATISVGA